MSKKDSFSVSGGSDKCSDKEGSGGHGRLVWVEEKEMSDDIGRSSRTHLASKA